VAAIVVGGAISITVVGIPVGVMGVDYGTCQVLAGGFRVFRGVRLTYRGFIPDKCQQNCDTGPNLVRLGVGVVPGGSLAERSSWSHDNFAGKPDRSPDWIDHLGSLLP